MSFSRKLELEAESGLEPRHPIRVSQVASTAGPNALFGSFTKCVLTYLHLHECVGGCFWALSPEVLMLLEEVIKVHLIPHLMILWVLGLCLGRVVPGSTEAL